MGHAQEAHRDQGRQARAASAAHLAFTLRLHLPLFSHTPRARCYLVGGAMRVFESESGSASVRLAAFFTPTQKLHTTPNQPRQQQNNQPTRAGASAGRCQSTSPTSTSSGRPVRFCFFVSFVVPLLLPHPPPVEPLPTTTNERHHPSSTHHPTTQPPTHPQGRASRT